MSKKPTEEEKKAQHAKFVEAAKAAECDDDEQRFAERVKKVAKGAAVDGAKRVK